MSDLLDLSAANTQSRFGRCAEVRVGDRVTRYVRRGSGLPVVIIGTGEEPHAVWAALAAALADGVRVIAPEATVAPAEFVTWLRGFAEGIGVTSAVLIVGGAWCAAATELQATGAGDFRALILIPGTDAGEASLHAVMDSRPDAALLPTLWVRPDWEPAEAVRRIQEFIGAVSA